MRAAISDFLLLPLMLLVLSGCSARMESPAVVGKINNYQHTDALHRSMNISWNCRTTGVLSSLFSPTGDSACNDEAGRGRVTVPIGPDGSFEIPAIDVKVTRFFSAPSLYFQWEILTERRNGQADSVLLTSGRLYDSVAFERVVDEYRSLRHIVIDDACIDSVITAVDGSDRFPFNEITRRYPDSYNMSVRYVLTMTLERDGEVVTSPRVSLENNGGEFCASNLGLFVTRNEREADEALSYFARIEAAAGVVYSRAAPDPVSGQQSQDYRYVDEVIVRKGKSRVTTINRLPAEMLEPINLELDITRPRPAD